jgi:hypothetical protein
VFLTSHALFAKNDYLVRVTKEEAIQYLFFGVVPNHARIELLRLCEGFHLDYPIECETCPQEEACAEGCPLMKEGYWKRPCESYRDFQKQELLCDVNFEM